MLFEGSVNLCTCMGLALAPLCTIRLMHAGITCKSRVSRHKTRLVDFIAHWLTLVALSGSWADVSQCGLGFSMPASRYAGIGFNSCQ